MNSESQQSFIRQSFSESITKLGLSILQTAKNPERIKRAGRYLGIPTQTELHKERVASFMDKPSVKEILTNRPSTQWPSREQMAAMPKMSLGWCVDRHLESLGLSFLVDQANIPETQTDEEYGLTRFFRLHDVHHTVLGLPITVAGEAAATAFYASTRSIPTDIATLSAWMLRSSYEPDERRLIWDAIGFGIEIGQVVPDLFSQRWEEGWERPMTDWQEELGITEILKKSPFRDEFETIYGLTL